MARLILWGILILLVVRALSRLLRGVLEGAGYRARDAAAAEASALVRDPVCGIFVVPGQALTSRHRHRRRGTSVPRTAGRKWAAGDEAGRPADSH